MLICEGLKTADAGSNNDTEAFWVSGGALQSGVGHGEFGGGHGELGIAVGSARVFWDFEPFGGFEVGDFASDLAVVIGDVEEGDAFDAADAAGDIFPEGIEIGSERGLDPHSCDDNSTRGAHKSGSKASPSQCGTADANAKCIGFREGRFSGFDSGWVGWQSVELTKPTHAKSVPKNVRMSDE